ncbi:MAG: T9SS type A sorting domain-containing protein, partial [Salibacteraceae bacterium]
DTASQTIEVDSVPVVSFSAISDVCIDNGLVTLTQGSPTGGFYTGTGVSGTDFNPLTATVGTHTLSYKFTDGNTCSDSSTQTITVNDLPTITLSALSAVCVTESPFTLTNGSPSGGTYSGIGISSNTFNPSVADTGTHVITYTYTDGNGCTNGDSTSIRVNPQPTVTLSSFSNVCANSGNLTLTGGLPTGGTYFGNNISSGQFDPVTAGAGTHTINYTYIDGNSCSDTTSQTIEVDSVPVVSLSTFSNLCSNSDSITLTGGTPLGGDYSINGSLIAGFSPNSHASGSHLIWYSFTDGNSCTDSVSRNLIVDTVTTLSFSPLSNICANDTLKNIDKALPKGGLYSGLGIVNDTLFDPSIPGGGIHTIKYIFTNSYNCSDSINQSITVDTIPIVSFILTQDSICANADSLFLIGTPSGGIFTGNGVQGNYINPSLLNSGYHFIEYNVTNTLGCTNSIIDSIRLDSVPALSMTFQDSICSNALPINLLNQGSPSGGVYSINGVSSTIYSPKNSSNTMDTIGYSFANNYGCSDSIYSIIRVDSITPLVQNPLPLVCSADTISLNHILPMGGIYSGNGIDTGVFISKNVAGEFPYKYEFTNLFGCTDSVIDTINVQASPVALMSPLGVICNNTPDFILKNGTPVGGVYIGSMVRLDSTFNSAGVQAGSYNLKYAVSDSNGCVDTASISINIDTVPSVSMATGPSLCSNAGLFKLTQGLPAGGTYSGLGVIQDSLFNPSIGFGNYNLKYSFTDLNGCSDSSFSSVGVDTLLKIDSLYFADLCAYGDTIVLNSGFPQGGRYFGLGVYDDTMYVAKNENSGIDTLSYVLESACGSDTMSIEYNLNGLPLVTIDSIKRLCVGPNPHLLKEGLPVGGNYFIDGKLDSLIGLTQSGTKTVSYRFIDSLGCEGSAFQEIEVNDNPSLNLTGFTPKLCSDLDSFQLDFGDAIEKTIWNGDTGIALVNLPVNQLAYGKNLIDVSAMNYRGCKSDTTLRLELVNCGDLISVWPNPSDGEFQIIFESGIEQEVTLVVLSSVGQRVLDTKLSLKPGRNVYDAFLDLGAGTYIVHVFIGEDDYWDKIVIR